MRVALLLALLLLAPAAHADDVVDPASPGDARLRRNADWDVGASVGASVPMGSAEHGSRTSDSTHALAAFGADATYRSTPALGAGATLRWGAAVPTLCGSTSECLGSLGRDVALVLRARFYLPPLLRAEPYVDLGVGWEWLHTTLEDGAARSSRSWNGPVLLSADAAVPFPLGRHVTLGPALGVMIGSFSSGRLDTPAFSTDLHPGGTLHAWPTLSARLGVHF